MNYELKELIEKSTINGSLSEKNKDYILEKAQNLGVSEIEVNIYIEAYLKENITNKININSINFRNINWFDKLSYLFGTAFTTFGLIIPLLLPNTFGLALSLFIKSSFSKCL